MVLIGVIVAAQIIWGEWPKWVQIVGYLIGAIALMVDHIRRNG